MARSSTAEDFNRASETKLPGYLGLVVLEVAPGRMVGRLALRPEVVAWTGYLSAIAVIGVADTLCAYGVNTVWPEGAVGFTTAELKCNFLGSLRDGAVRCEAELVHGGRTTQVWDAVVTREDDGRKLALFRCTQMILYPR